jgi:hypothetical protein
MGRIARPKFLAYVPFLPSLAGVKATIAAREISPSKAANTAGWSCGGGAGWQFTSVH